MKRPCDACGIPTPPDDLTPGGTRLLCPRCWALERPASLQAGGGSGPPHWPTGTAAAAAPASAPAPAAAGADPGLAIGATARLDAAVRAWAAGRAWWIRAPVLAWMVWILVHYWNAPWYSTLWAGIDLAFHEMGHYLWAPLGDFMAAAGGTLTQCLIPVAAGALLLRQRDWFGVAVAICWLGINCFEVVEYAGDAMARRLPLVSPGAGEPEHDWGYMLTRLGLLERYRDVAAAWQWAGRLVMAGGIAFGGWVLWVMAWTPAPAAAPPGAQLETRWDEGGR